MEVDSQAVEEVQPKVIMTNGSNGDHDDQEMPPAENGMNGGSSPVPNEPEPTVKQVSAVVTKSPSPEPEEPEAPKEKSLEPEAEAESAPESPVAADEEKYSAAAEEEVELAAVEESKDEKEAATKSPVKSPKSSPAKSDVPADPKSPSKSPVKKEKVAKTPSPRKTGGAESSTKKPAVTPLFEADVLVEGKRRRSTVDRLGPTENTLASSSKKAIESEGTGIKLGEIEFINHAVTHEKADELKAMHRVLYGRTAKASLVRKHIRLFNGFPFNMDSKEMEKKKAALHAKTFLTADLKRVCGLCGLERGGSKDELIERCLSFLVKPTDHGKAVPQKKAAKRKSASKGKSKKSAAKKSPKAKAAKGKATKDEEEDGDDSSDAADSSDDEDDKKDEKQEEDSTDTEEAAPPAKKAKKDSAPSDADLKKAIAHMMQSVNLEQVTMKTMLKQVMDKYPKHDLMARKDFIKTTIKAVITGDE